MLRDAILLGAGSMGMRHLVGLANAGFKCIHIFEPEQKNFLKAHGLLTAKGLDCRRVTSLDAIPKVFDAAIFCGPADSRLALLQSFLSVSFSKRILLEKPLCSSKSDLDTYAHLSRQHNLSSRIGVNFVRRFWPHITKLKELLKEDSDFTMTANGGAIGIGCNGVHFLDMFKYLAGTEDVEVLWSDISKMEVLSGRGERFKDLGGDFLLRALNSKFFCSFAPDSYTNVTLTVKATKFSATVDYGTSKFRILIKDEDVKNPVYRYGYGFKNEVIDDASIMPPEEITKAWALNKFEVVSLEQAINTHHLLFEILEKGGKYPPYHFT